MIKSMTGYGGSCGETDDFAITVELKSVNNRFLDCNIRMPRTYLFIEEEMKKIVQKHISRGKVDIYVTVEQKSGSDVRITVNKNLAGEYISAVSEIAGEYGLLGELSAFDVAKFPEVLITEKVERDSKPAAEMICSVLEEALCKFDDMRSAEGEKMAGDILERLDSIEGLVAAVEKRSPEVLREYHGRLLKKITDILDGSNIDESRILTEAAIFADKIAVDEETVRLRSHIAQMRGFVHESEPVGRKMDFLIQEFNRESNTIGSKGNDIVTARYVVDLKAEIEKIREQIQNIE